MKKVSVSSSQKKKTYSRPSERGFLSPSGGAWNLKTSERMVRYRRRTTCRTMAGKNKQIPCAYYIGRRILLPREGFKAWFNSARPIERGFKAAALEVTGGYAVYPARASRLPGNL